MGIAGDAEGGVDGVGATGDAEASPQGFALF